MKLISIQSKGNLIARVTWLKGRYYLVVKALSDSTHAGLLISEIDRWVCFNKRAMLKEVKIIMKAAK